MISSHRTSLDFRPTTSSPLAVKPLRPLPSIVNGDRQDLDARLIGDSPLMRSLKQSIGVVATSSETVLITGESGTGKELIARAIHDLSPRRGNAYLAINCGALNESLLESELFGHLKGAFTGANTNKRGYFEAANGGTLFLDEFAEISLSTQQRLLRVLQEQKVRPVGSSDTREIEVDVRILVATNRDLRQDILDGRFRQDLYYRVNVLQVHSPALRDRRGDLATLMLHFIRKYNERNSSTILENVMADVVAVLEAYTWPGNVRELENITKRLCLTAALEGLITREYLDTIGEFNQLFDDSRSIESQMVISNITVVSSPDTFFHQTCTLNESASHCPTRIPR